VFLGKEHDYSLLKEVLPPNKPWFKNKRVRLDSGYQGFQNDYECSDFYLPLKKSKNKELTEEQKARNREAASERIKVEHSIAGLKRFRVLSDRARIKDWQLFDSIIGVCAGLWNFSKIHLNH
jgi:DDE superfamily endonuclease